ncbi:MULTISPECIES: SEC10/PgrA surface exclusion domain-containing protein [Lacticaseibacillus]|uniref:SEC10/PgrA surface exclusion domain-containing protein n=1 Tax=Lacticaseibacillus TaxID=2759736 RepID=UPI00063DA1AC|nr:MULTISPECIES: SEC10/PgrA surface exclusion domain-containing protein [Lacticaseibacillus]KLI76920.1 cell surface protein [Lacticaseibacillus casei]
MLYNRFAQHVVNDKKKMYKRGSQWVVASAFALAIGGFGVTQAQTVQAVETQPQLTVQSATLVNKTDATTPSSAAVSQTAQAQAATVATSQAAAAAQQKAASTVSAQAAQPASAAARVANAAVKTDATAPSSGSMTDEQWKAAKAKYDQAKADAAKQESAAKSQADAAKSAYPDQIDKQLNDQKAKDTADYYQYQKDGWSDLMTLRNSQADSYAAASQAATKEISDLNAERVTPNVQVGDGGTFNFVARTGAWSNIVTPNDQQNKTWNGNFLVQNLSVFTDDQVNSIDKLDPLSNPADRKPFDNYSDKADLEHMSDDVNTPSWVLSDTVQNDQLSAAQKAEVNQYAMMLINNYRKALSIVPLVSTESFLALVQERSDSMRTDTDMHHNAEAINRIFGQGKADECIANANPNGYKGTRTGSLTMVEVLQAVADDINGMLNWDGDSDQGHRQILLSEDGDVTGAFAIQKIGDNEWVLNFNGVHYLADGKNIATVPEKDSSLPVDNNHEIDVKVEQVQSKINNLKTQQQKDYQAAYDNYSDKLSSIAEKINADYDAIRQIPQKIQTFNEQQDASVQALAKKLDAAVAQLDPGPEPNTPASGGSSSASSANSSSSSSAASSATSSATSSASSSASSSAASSANGSSASSTASSATSSAGSSAASSSSSSAASSAGSSAGSSAASSATSSAASSAGSSASSSAASSANSSNASSAASSATSSAASSAASSASSSATFSEASSAASSTASSATSSTASSAASSASSSAASSANSSTASSATDPAATTPAGSNAPKPATGPAKSATVTPLVKTGPASTQPLSRMTQKYGKHVYPATGESQNGIVLAEAGALIIAVLGFAGVRKYRHAK